MTEALAGRLGSREILRFGCRPCGQKGKAISIVASSQAACEPGAGVGFEARQVQPLDDAPDLARRMLLVDEAFDIERLEPHLVAVEGKVTR